MKKLLFIISCTAASHTMISAQNLQGNDSLYLNKFDRWKASFSFQSDIHYTTRKSGQNAPWAANTYITGNIQNEVIEIGMRLEEITHPLPGHEVEKGWGFPNNI